MRLNASAMSAMTGRVQQQERWDNGQISFLPSLTDGAGVAMPCGHTSRTIPPKPGTALTAEAPASYTGHLQGLGKSGLGAVSYNLPGLGTPPSQKIHRAWHVTYSGVHDD